MYAGSKMKRWGIFTILRIFWRAVCVRMHCACIKMHLKQHKTHRSTDDGYKLAQLFTHSDIVEFVLACGHECGKMRLDTQTRYTRIVSGQPETSQHIHYTWNSSALLRHFISSNRNDCVFRNTRFFKWILWHFPLYFRVRFGEAQFGDMWYRINSKFKEVLTHAPHTSHHTLKYTWIRNH